MASRTEDPDSERPRRAPCSGAWAAVAGLVLASWAPGSLLAQQVPTVSANDRATDLSARRTLQARRLAPGESIDLDGDLSEAPWSLAIPATGFRQKDPVEDADPSQPTEVRVVYDDDNLYIGAILFDDDPDGILGYQKRRDAGLGTDDRFMFILDTFMDSRTGYFFETNPVGLLGDGLITGGGGGGFGINKSWDGIWDVRTTLRPDGWSVEIRIPFRTLNFDPTLDHWGINFQRTVRRVNEEISWSGTRRNQPFTNPVHAGLLTGLEGMTQGLGLEVKPYALGAYRSQPQADDPTEYPTEVGGDLQYNITSGLRAGLSINTDFAEVEVDQRRVNLSRFPLFFPEQRDFFLEGSSVYEFAPRSGPRPYFSRRIGINQGQQIPINWGVRLGGQVGRYELGFLQMRTGKTEVAPKEDFTVARVRRNVWAQSSFGFIFTRRGTQADSVGYAPSDRYTFGVDTNLATATLFGDKNLQFEAFWVWNTEPDPVPDEPLKAYAMSEITSRGFRFNFPNDVYEAHLSYREFGAEYRPAVGFVSRRDFRRVEPRVGWNPRTESLNWLRRLEFGLQYRYLEGLQSRIKEEEQWQFEVLGLQFESGDQVEFQVQRTYEFLTEDFEIWEGIVVEQGGYTVWTNTLEARTAGRRRLSARGELQWGGFWDGDIVTGELGVTVRPSPGLNLTAEYERNDVRLPDGSFHTNLARIEGGWNATPLIALTGSLQYDDVSDITGLFAKLHWIVQPGNDVFFVVTHNWWRDPEQTDAPLSTLSRGATLKVNYTFRF